MKNFQKLGFLTVAFVVILFSCSKDGGVKSIESDSVCGNVTDIDGNIYPSVKIGGQCWTQKNLNVSKYRNGDPIPQVQDPTDWAALKTGGWCYYENKTANGTVYGKLYNWYAVKDPRGLAPAGYHIPTDTEWITLTTALGGEPVAGGKMKSTGTILWYSPNTGASNSSGFTGLPGGRRDSSGQFDLLRADGSWWVASDYGLAAYYHYLYCLDDYAYRSDRNKTYGLSVRCLKD